MSGVFEVTADISLTNEKQPNESRSSVNSVCSPGAESGSSKHHDVTS